jgi:Tol biopolymer transport system component
MRIAYTSPALDRDIVRTGLAEPFLGQTAVLVSTTKDEYAPRWSPHGNYVTFLSDKSGAREIWICDQDGGNQRKLTGREAGNNIVHPTWSPDGRRIAFQSDARQTEIFVFDINRGSVRQVTSAGGLRPAWSASGEWIYFFSARDGINRIWKISPDGAGEQILVETRQNGLVAESTDGKRLYFSQHPDLMVLTPQEPGKLPVRVTSELFAQSTFSASGKGVYYLTASGSLRFYDPERRANREILVLREDIGGSGISVSHDGRWLIYTRRVSSGSDLMMLESAR